jgi:diaminohydroxyphosphoribosylaminopyrimidine deaminase/5-amino-6-(5-phosphoribosylamino)uracil reductase
MRQALALAANAVGLSDPNPRVGCVITSAAGALLATGYTREAGGPHAEVVALQAARQAGVDVRGATVHVSLEPCAHHGRTGPCCDALVEAGVARVVVGIADPNPLVAGQGIARLRAAGIQVDVGVCADEARELNIGFFSRMLRRRPWVRMKVAASLDGRTALDNGTSQWITGEPARADGHAFRKRAGAVLTGVGTVLEDDPRLDVRHVATARQPLRVVVDSRLDMPPGARVLAPPGACLVYAAAPDASRAAALRAAGAEIALLPGANGKVELRAMLHDLAARGINELHVEAGFKLNGSLVREDLVDEFLMYVAPRLLGSGAGVAAIGPFERIDQAPALRFVAHARVGEDLRIIARPPGREAF